MSDERNDICVVTTYKRDELLYLCLEAIRVEDSAIEIWVCSDRGHRSEDLEATCANFNAQLTVLPPHDRFGNSLNVLRALRLGTEIKRPAAQIVHLVEDDTIIYPGYFDWARNKLTFNDERIPKAKPASIYAVALGRIPADTLSTWYESPCVSWNAKCLKQCLDLVPHDYIATSREAMQTCLDGAFPRSRFIYGSAEQDGFFLRCLELLAWKSGYPDRSFASHLGWWGYNREGGTPPAGTFLERVKECRRVFRDRQKRMELFGQGITDREMGGMA